MVKARNKKRISKEDIWAFSVAKKMARRFLTERIVVKKPQPHFIEKMTEEELAKELGVKLKQFKSFGAGNKEVDKKIALALITLYCDTSWEFV